MISFERKMELEEQLKEAGNDLLNPPSSIDDFLILLDRVENLLTRVGQAPPRSMQKALLPLMKGLISNAVLTHSNMDVKVSVASCITEITRITAPDAPYNDEIMKEIFQLTVAAFENLSNVPSRCNTKAVSILHTVARVRLCLVMLDLECDELIIKMFEHFLKKIRSNHPHTVYLAMESIMTLVLDESEDISWALLSPLLASVMKENQKIFPASWKLAEKVILNCAHKLKPYFMEAVKSMDIALDEYSPIISSVCKLESDNLEYYHVNKSGDHMVKMEPGFCGELCEPGDGIPKSLMRNKTGGTRDRGRNNDVFLNTKPSKILEHCSRMEVPRSAAATDGADPGSSLYLDPVKSETELYTLPKKRERRPKFSEEGYKHSWVCSLQVPHQRKAIEKGVDGSSFENQELENAAVNLINEKVPESKELSFQIDEIRGLSSASPHGGVRGGGHLIRGCSVSRESMTTEKDNPDFSLAKRLELKAQIREKPTLTASGGLKIKSEPKSLNTKWRKRSRTVEVEAKRAQAPVYFVQEKEVKVQSDHEEKRLQQPTEKKANNKTLFDYTMLDKSICGASGDQKTISEPATTAEIGACCSKKTPKINPKRQRNAEKRMASELPDFGEELIGRRIKVWWPIDKMFYEGVVASYDPIKMKHRVFYDDGDEERLNLRRERWQLIHEKGQETDLPKPVVSPDILQKQKVKAHSRSRKSTKDRSSLNRNNARASASTRKSKYHAEGAMVDDPMFHESVKDASRIDSRSSGAGQMSGAELKVESKSVESELTVPKRLASSDGTTHQDGGSPNAIPL